MIAKIVYSPENILSLVIVLSTTVPTELVIYVSWFYTYSMKEYELFLRAFPFYMIPNAIRGFTT